MRGLFVALLLVAAPLAAGCLSATGPDEGLARGVASLGVAGAPPLEGDAYRWSGNLAGSRGDHEAALAELACFVTGERCRATPPPCDGEASCSRVEVDVDVPADHWETHVGALVVSVRWPTMPGPTLDAWIEDASGAVVAYSPDGYAWTTGQVAALHDPAPGRYVAVVAARDGDAPFEAAVRLESRPRPLEPVELLPDLVALPPSDLRLETPDYAGISYFAFPVPLVREAAEAAGTKGCRIDEIIETSGRRCLRFSTLIGNVGDGPLDITLPVGAQTFTQRVHRTDGSIVELEAGPAEWHATHAHWHNAAANRYTLHAYDPETRARGEPIGEGKKGGICFADTGIVDVGLPVMRAPTFPGRGCVDPSATKAWSMGIDPGWYDAYGYVLSDQYVEIAGVEDGTYLLCVAINVDGTLLEIDPDNNEGCTAFRLTGDAVELLDEPPYYEERR